MNIRASIDASEANMTSKGQVLIPKVFRDRAGLVPGQPVTVAMNDRGEVVIKPGRPVETPEQRLLRIRAAIDAVAGTVKTGFGSTDAYMDFIRPWRKDPL